MATDTKHQTGARLMFGLLCFHPKTVDIVVKFALCKFSEGLVRVVDEVGEGAVIRVVPAIWISR
jgi:hypothetical protein